MLRGPTASIVLVLLALAAALGLLAGCGSGGDDTTDTPTSPPITTGPLAQGTPLENLRSAYRDLLAGPFEANSTVTVEFSAEGADDEIEDAARDLEVNIDLRSVVENERRRQLAINVRAGDTARFLTVVEYDGEAFISVNDGSFRALAPALVETLGATETLDDEPLLAALGPLTDLGDGERGGRPTRSYGAPLDVEYLRRNGGGTFGSAAAAGITFTSATGRFELQTDDGKLAFQAVYARAERDLSEASGGRYDGTLIADLSATTFIRDQERPQTVERPEATGDPIETQEDLADSLRRR